MDLRPMLGLVLGLVVAWALLVGLLWVLRPRDVGVRETLAVVPDLIRLVRDLIADSATPLDVRITLAAMLAYLVSPIDLVPELIPVIGQLDDVVVGVLALRYTRRRLGSEVLRSRWQGSASGFDLLERILG
jgi:uncharacterized membrane protein YkvA (DUF1232 family)